MNTIPPHSLDRTHTALVLRVWAAPMRTTYDVYCPKCEIYLGRLLTTESAAIRVAGRHRFEYGIRTVPALELELERAYADGEEG